MRMELHNQRWLLLIALIVICSGCSMLGPKPAYDDASPVRVGSSRSYDAHPASFESEDPKPKLGLSDFAPQNLPRTVRRIAGEDTSTMRQTAQREYKTAEATYNEASRLKGAQRKAKFLEAAALFETAAELYPESAVEHDSLYMLGACHFFADNYVASNDAYELLLDKYPNSKMLDAVESHRFSIGQYWLQLHDEHPQSFFAVNLTNDMRPWRDTKGNAMRIFDKIRIDDPTGKLADDATMALANAQFRSGRYILADSTYTDLRKTFPDSEHQFDAHVLGIKSKLLNYQGADYSGDVLDQAEKLIQQARAQFPRQAQEEDEYLSRAFAEVRYKKAERLWAKAQFYDRRKEFRAAKHYFKKVLDEYADTPFQQRARARVAELAGEPDIPPQHLSWLVGMFPTEEDVQPMIATKPNDNSAR